MTERVSERGRYALKEGRKEGRKMRMAAASSVSETDSEALSQKTKGSGGQGDEGRRILIIVG